MRRHLIAVRWRDWRLYRKYERDAWKLFDLKSDPHEERDVSGENPQVVQRMQEQHAAWAGSLSPLAQVPKVKGAGRPIVPVGHGWAFSDGVQQDADSP